MWELYWTLEIHLTGENVPVGVGCFLGREADVVLSVLRAEDADEVWDIWHLSVAVLLDADDLDDVQVQPCTVVELVHLHPSLLMSELSNVVRSEYLGC